MPPTYKDIQRITGLSLATISKHFNGRTVREENKQAIEAAATRLGFRVNEVARSLRTRRSRTVGVVLPQLDNDFHLQIVAGVEEGLRDSGIGVVVCSSQTATHSGYTGAVDLLQDRQVDGIIVVPSAHDESALVASRARGVPLVLVDRLVPGLDHDAVVLDNRGASALAVDELRRHGHTDIAVITGSRSVWTMAERLAGYEEAMRADGLSVTQNGVVEGPLTVETGQRGMHRLLSRTRRPTAVLTTNYELTLGALIALAQADVDVPGEMSFIGFDSETLAQVTRPRTTVVTQPQREIARVAAELMQARLTASDDGGAPDARAQARTVVLPGTLLAGASVGPPPGGGHRTLP